MTESIVWIILLSDVESCYSQAKLELYGLFHALHAVCIFIFGVNNFTVEMDAKYIQGMINNLDLQPNVTMNWWITGNLLFGFRLIHIPATHHTGADGLSHRLPSNEDPPKEDDFEDWLDNSYSFLITLLNDCASPYGGSAHFSRHLHGSLMDDKLVWFALYNAASPTHSPFPSATPVLVIMDSDSHHNDLAIPHAVKACAKDDQINQIRKFLQDHIHPPGLLDSDYTSFINVAACLFLLNGSLYCQEKHGWHQLIVPVEHHYGLIQEAHNM